MCRAERLPELKTKARALADDHAADWQLRTRRLGLNFSVPKTTGLGSGFGGGTADRRPRVVISEITLLK